MSKLIELFGADGTKRLRELLELLADPTRQDLVFLFLEKGEWNAGELAERFPLSRATISHHANSLVRGGVLAMRKVGKERFYTFRKTEVVGLLDIVVSTLKTCC